MRGDVILIIAGAAIIVAILLVSLMKTAGQCSREEERRELERLMGKMDQEEGK